MSGSEKQTCPIARDSLESVPTATPMKTFAPSAFFVVSSIEIRWGTRERVAERGGTVSHSGNGNFIALQHPSFGCEPPGARRRIPLLRPGRPGRLSLEIWAPRLPPGVRLKPPFPRTHPTKRVRVRCRGKGSRHALPRALWSTLPTNHDTPPWATSTIFAPN